MMPDPCDFPALHLPRDLGFTDAAEVEGALVAIRAAVPSRHAGYVLGCLGDVEGLDIRTRDVMWAMASHLDAWSGHAYHNALHHLDVFIIAMTITHGGRYSARRIGNTSLRALLALAALAHDMGYEPARHGPFANEIVASAMAISDISGLRDLVDPAVLNTVILSTAPHIRPALAGGYSVWRDVLARRPAAAGDIVTAPEAYTVACLLADADIASSIGLSQAWMGARSENLAVERGLRIIPPADTIAFCEKLAAPPFLTRDCEVICGQRLLENTRDAAISARTSLKVRSS